MCQLHSVHVFRQLCSSLQSHQSYCSASVTWSHLLLSEPWLFIPDLNSGALYLYALSELHCHVIQSPLQQCHWLKNRCIQNWVANKAADLKMSRAIFLGSQMLICVFCAWYSVVHNHTRVKFVTTYKYNWYSKIKKKHFIMVKPLCLLICFWHVY